MQSAYLGWNGMLTSILITLLMYKEKKISRAQRPNHSKQEALVSNHKTIMKDASLVKSHRNYQTSITGESGCTTPSTSLF